LEALMYAFNNNYPVVFAEHRKPFRFDYFEPEVDLSCLKIPGAVKSLTTFEEEKAVGIPKNILWERLLFLLSLDSKAPLSNLCKSIRCGEQSLSCFNEYSKIAEIKFQTCYYFGDEGARGIVSQKTLAEKEYICYDWVAFNRGGKHNIDHIKTNDPFVNEIWFYSSDRIDGNTPVKDACAVSIVTEKQMLDFDYSETMARFKLVHEMESRGMKGKFNGYSPTGRPRYYKFRTSHIYRTKYKERSSSWIEEDGIKTPRVKEEDLLQALPQAALAYDRFLRNL